MPHPELFDWIDGYRHRRGHFGQRSAVRPPELEDPVGPARDLIALLVDGPVMAATEQGEIRERGRAALRPVAHVMPLHDPHLAPREAAAPVSLLQGAP